MKLILTRHGETVENQQGIIQGHNPGTLSEEGKEQARKVALRLMDEKIDAIYSSDLARAADTAKEIAKYHPKAAIEFVKELRERDLGGFSGKTRREIDWGNLPRDVESLVSMQKRVKGLLDKAYVKYANGTVLFVGHHGINRALITAIFSMPADYIDIIERPSNASISIFEITEDNRHRVHILNDVKHLG